jgi:hypothetical protein
MSLPKISIRQMLSRAIAFSKATLKDSENLRLLLVLSLVPIVHLIPIGYFVEIIKKNPEIPLKLEKSKWTKYLADGFLFGIYLFIYMLVAGMIFYFSILVPSGILVAISIVGKIDLSYDIFSILLMIIIMFTGTFFILLLLMGVPAVSVSFRTGDTSKLLAYRELWGMAREIGLLKFFALLIVLYFWWIAEALFLVGGWFGIYVGLFYLLTLKLEGVFLVLIGPLFLILWLFLWIVFAKVLALLIDVKYPASVYQNV